MHTLQGQQHTTNAANSTVLPTIFRLLDSTADALADAWSATTVTSYLSLPNLASRVASFPGLPRFSSSVCVQYNTEIVWELTIHYVCMVYLLFLNIVSQAAPTTTLTVGAENTSLACFRYWSCCDNLRFHF